MPVFFPKLSLDEQKFSILVKSTLPIFLYLVLFVSKEIFSFSKIAIILSCFLRETM